MADGCDDIFMAAIVSKVELDANNFAMWVECQIENGKFDFSKKFANQFLRKIKLMKIICVKWQENFLSQNKHSYTKILSSENPNF